ncbi:hypothetical protein RND81_02G020900 [Saponaria officinalis]
MDRWQEDPHMYPNPNIGPPHYDSWRGAPSVNPPGGVWYRGPPGPTPYGGPVPPGGFHMEPFPYYRPQVPAPVLGNSQPIPPPGPGPHGHHPKNGDMYRPHMPESFMRPVGPMRPGFYPPPVAYDGYYRPPMGFCNPNERDFSFMGMATGPHVYNRPMNPNGPYPNSSHPRPEGRGPDKIDPGLLHAPRGDHAILAKPNEGWNQNDREKWGHRVTTEGSNRERGILSNATLQENAWGDDCKTSKSVDHGENSAKDDLASRPRDNKSHSNNPASSMASKKFSNAEEPGTGPATDNLASSRDHSLIQKIEGLNAKARASGGSQDAFHREELTERVQVVNVWARQSVNEADPEVVFERHHPTGVLVPVTRDTNVVASEKTGDPALTTGPRSTVHGAPNRSNRHDKGNFDGQKASGWGRKSYSHSDQSVGSNSTTNDRVVNVQPSEVHKANIEKNDGESAVSEIDCTDTQRAKMREIARQRAIQLQKEEEERVKEQKAKAQAKLEELNRRSATTQGVDVPSQKETVPPHSTGPLKPDDSKDLPDSEAKSTAGSSSVFSERTTQINENSVTKVVDSATTLRHARAGSKKNAQQDSVSSQIQSPTGNVYLEDDADNRTAPRIRDVSKPKLSGHKPLQNVPPEKNVSQNSILVGQIVVLKDHKMEIANQELTVGGKVDEGGGKALLETPLVSDSAAAHKRRSNNKNGKNKQKVESSDAVSPNDCDLGHAVSATAEDNASNLRTDSSSVQLAAATKEPSQVSEDHSSLSREDVHGKMNNSWKAQNSRKPRNYQGNRLSGKVQSNDTVVWAPVHSQTKVDVIDQTSQKAAEPLVSSAVGESRPLSSSKTKRAEMERYIPKPVAKELAQQGSIQQPPSVLVDHPPVAKASQDSSSGTGGRDQVPQGSEHVAKVGAVVESKNRHAKNHGSSWRQRTSSESTAAQLYSSVGSTNKNIQPSGGQTARPSESMMIEPPHLSMEGLDATVTDGWNIVNDSSSKSSAAVTGVKDQLPSRKGKSHPFKGHKGSGYNLDHKDSNAVLSDTRAAEVTHTEKTVLSPREKRAVVDRSAPHWQPKSQTYVAPSQQGIRSHGSQNHVVEDIKGSKPVIGSGSGASELQSAAKDPRPGSGDKAMHDTGHQNSKREKRGPHVKGVPHSHGEVLEAEVDFALSEGADRRNEQRPYSGYRKNSNYGGRVNRAHESRGDWSTMEGDNRQHYSSVDQERQRQNAHYEYQPVGPYNSNESGSQIDNQHGGPKFRERGRPRRGRGNFHGRQSGNE